MPPLVSCILPTKNRAAFIPQAIRSFQSQTYAHTELLIVDNGEDETEKLVPSDSRIRYAHAGGIALNTGDMRNLCAKYAKGQFICHFDSDDWSAPTRVADQIARLGEHGVVTGYHTMLFYDVRDGKVYEWHLNRSPIVYVLGTSLCYTREWWRHHPFPSLMVGEDVKFFQTALRLAHRLVPTAPARGLMVARVHGHQTSQKTLNRTSYTPMTPASLPEGFPCDSISLAI